MSNYIQKAKQAIELEARGLYRRAACIWRDALPLAPTMEDQSLCASNAQRCSDRGKYKGKTEL
ncbi:ANR family transcriptional regulator [Yersinia ruckeri]|uniref:ANR family transcriptional regulator n=1 Tax=Yersinia ruckeri TaxID=29486 RepID=UPI001F41B3B6|nr:ANR family transcriptional regulator [Yersinia ruckeri]UIN00057.1 ANR family transcriptional regulator [Yersinia ruckeri]UIN00102.1 ANR family transcriptional regulator [Yersinia ruckeri]